MNLYERRKKKLLYATNLFFLKDNLIALAGAKDMIDSIVRTEKLTKEDLKKLKTAWSCRDIIGLEI
ncbi:MAG TPA: hypothetical protein VJH92_02875 [Candidatus Nanoarchaeia archaeon]|nr:hypothetical protein [Candidatus Nanoarchaeia archaeon]